MNLFQFYEMTKFLGISVAIFLKQAEGSLIPEINCPRMRRTHHFSGLTAIHRTERDSTALSNTAPFYATRERTNDWSSMFYVRERYFFKIGSYVPRDRLPGQGYRLGLGALPRDIFPAEVRHPRRPPFAPGR